MSKKKKGQSTLEYIIIVAVVVAAIITFATTAFQGRIGASMNHVAEQMENVVVNRIKY